MLEMLLIKMLRSKHVNFQSHC